MVYLLIKAAISGLIIAVVSEVARRAPSLGALIASLPLISVLGMIWLWRDNHDGPFDGNLLVCAAEPADVPDPAHAAQAGDRLLAGTRRRHRDHDCALRDNCGPCASLWCPPVRAALTLPQRHLNERWLFGTRGCLAELPGRAQTGTGPRCPPPDAGPRRISPQEHPPTRPVGIGKSRESG
jgi:hypothetical protein